MPKSTAKQGSAKQRIQCPTGTCIEFTTAIMCHWNVVRKSIQQKN